MKKRVVITGFGIQSSIGKTKQDVLDSLYHGKSGIIFEQVYVDHGFRSHVCGKVEGNFEENIPRKALRFMGDSAAYAWISMRDAIADANLNEDQVKNIRTGLIAGSGCTSLSNVLESVSIAEKKKVSKYVGPYRVPRCMGSSVSACLSNYFGIKGINYSISSACATSLHCVGNAYEMISYCKQDVMFAGGGEELHWAQSLMFDAMGSLSSKHNHTPEKASRAYDANRDGFVIAGGGGIVVLESLEHAQARGAKIYAEILGYGATSDGYDMVQPSGEGAVRCMNMALSEAGNPKIDYINTHGTSTPIGDTKELEAIAEVFGDDIPPISSTKSMAGHSLGAAGAQELIYSLLMLENNFCCESINIEEIEPKHAKFPILRERLDTPLQIFMTNGFGFGGTNATLVCEKI